MRRINGIAKRYDGIPVDYVSIFNWANGKCLAQITPNSLGEWEYTYGSSLEVGITYVADGCEPITHGAYNFNVAAPTDTIVHYSFNGNTIDLSDRGLDGIKTGDVIFSEGRKVGTQCANFTNGCIQTPSALQLGVASVTASFWISAADLYSAAIILEIGVEFGTSKSFMLTISDFSPAAIGVLYQPQQSAGRKSSQQLDTAWHHVCVTINTAESTGNECFIYIDNVDVTASHLQFTRETTGNLGSGVLYIGQRAASAVPFNGKLQDFRLYDRVITAEERTLLFTE